MFESKYDVIQECRI